MPGPDLPERANQTTAEQPWPVRVLSMKIADYVDKMSGLWVEGQVVQLNRRPGAGLAFLTLRDPDVDMSLTVTLPGQAIDRMPTPLSSGARVVVQARPTFWTKRGTLQLEGRQVADRRGGGLRAGPVDHRHATDPSRAHRQTSCTGLAPFLHMCRICACPSSNAACRSCSTRIATTGSLAPPRTPARVSGR